jgi:hypothetical protein
MNKRSAMLMAAGLVFTLLVGGVAIAIGLTGPAASAAAPRVVVRHKAPKPIVKTIKKTITVHKKAPQSSGGGTISYAAPSAPTWAPAPVSQAASYSSSAPSSGYHDDGGHDGGAPNGGGGGDD